jgi:DNA invertase Pin-like site-specific DNA recombinase
MDHRDGRVGPFPDSRTTTNRKALGKAIAALQAGDVLLVTRLDRLARSTRDLLNVLATIGDKGAGFRSLADTWADTTTAHGRLMVTILGGLAEFERELIKARIDDGRKRAMGWGSAERSSSRRTRSQKPFVDETPARR